MIPVYPLWSGLQVGDVYLVRTPMSMQQKEYNAKGFLALENATMTRLYHGTNNLVAHNADLVGFPTYSFQATRSAGLAAAFPIEAIPVALTFLGTDQVNGVVSITEALCSSGERGDILGRLREWAAKPEVRQSLSMTAKGAAPTCIYLRVITKVFYVKQMDISLTRADQQKFGGKAGFIKDAPMLSTNTAFTTFIAATNLAKAAEAVSPVLNDTVDHLTSLAQIGGSASFVSADNRTVGLSSEGIKKVLYRPVSQSYSLSILINTESRALNTSSSISSMLSNSIK
jgi:hypothetical protein